MQYDRETLRRLQLVELGILEDIDKVCREHGIAYFLDSGTVLGAVRHGGFIPWDDDIDIGMLRDDYERFLEIAPEALGSKYVVSSPRTNDCQAGFFAKVMLKGTRFVTEETESAGFEQGIFVDVFSYDLVSDNPALEKKQRRGCFFWQSMSYLYHSGDIVVPHHGFLGRAERIACKALHVAVKHLLSPARIAASFERAVFLGGSGTMEEDSRFLDMSCALFKAFPKNMLFPVRLLMFEGRKFPVPARTEEYLTYLYGKSWNQLPPEDRRRNHAPKELVF